MLKIRKFPHSKKFNSSIGEIFKGIYARISNSADSFIVFLLYEGISPAILFNFCEALLFGNTF